MRKQFQFCDVYATSQNVYISEYHRNENNLELRVAASIMRVEAPCPTDVYL